MRAALPRGPLSGPSGRLPGALPRSPLGQVRSSWGWALALLGPPALTALLLNLRGVLGLQTDLLFFFTLVVLTALVGGLAPALVAALLGSSLLNYFFTEPTGGLRIADPEQALALVLFTLVAGAVASVVHLAERSRRRAAHARELEQGNAVRTALLSAASHDLRTPLAATRTAVDGLRSAGRGLDVDDRAALLETIDLSTARLEALIANLLDLSMLHTGALRPELYAVSLDEVVLPVLGDLGDGHEVRAEIPESLPLVLTDAGLLERVVANLVSNAVRVSPSGVPVQVRAGAVDGEAVVVLSVVDHGPGVPSEDRERMFAPFQRLDDIPSGPEGGARPQGLGLGLAVARGLAEAVGARLRVAATPGGGLTVDVVVPVAGPTAPAEP